MRGRGGDVRGWGGGLPADGTLASVSSVRLSRMTVDKKRVADVVGQRVVVVEVIVVVGGVGPSSATPACTEWSIRL